jgi:hypothetical protein
MSSTTRVTALAALLAIGLTSCADRATAPSDVVASDAPALSSVKFWDANAPADWNELATSLQTRRPAPGVFRLYTYLALAQLRAAEDAQAIKPHPPTSAAIAAASATILTRWFPFDEAEIQRALDAQAAAQPWPGATHQDFAAGAVIGRAAAARVIAFSLGDRVGLADPGNPPVGAGFWLGTSAVRAGYMARPFFLESDHELRPEPPPTFGSLEYERASAEVLAISRNRTEEQIKIARDWAANQSGASDAAMTGEAVRLIRKHHRGELESARILFRLAAATFDAAIGCANAKFDYWYIRPAQADSRITTVFNAPAHPSYPSGHSCHSGASTGVMAAAFPSERKQLADMAEEASLSRLYAGIHYRFDMVAGLELGRKAAAKAVAADLSKVAIR